MARPRHLYVFCYDIARNSDRLRVANILDDHLVRVQQSVFEGRMTHSAAEALAERSRLAMGPDDSLRVYCVTEDGLENSLAFGGAPMAEKHDFWIA